MFSVLKTSLLESQKPIENPPKVNISDAFYEKQIHKSFSTAKTLKIKLIRKQRKKKFTHIKDNNPNKRSSQRKILTALFVAQFEMPFNFQNFEQSEYLR